MALKERWDKENPITGFDEIIEKMIDEKLREEHTVLQKEEMVIAIESVKRAMVRAVLCNISVETLEEFIDWDHPARN